MLTDGASDDVASGGYRRPKRRTLKFLKQFIAISCGTALPPGDHFCFATLALNKSDAEKPVSQGDITGDIKSRPKALDASD